MSDVYDLKPCPFCGGPLNITFHQFSQKYKLECQTWTCPTNSLFVSEAKAAIAINTRATSPEREALKKCVEALEQAYDCINGETPEDISFGEAEDDTLSKIRAALAQAQASAWGR
jgi:hypothetical protein